MLDASPALLVGPLPSPTSTPTLVPFRPAGPYTPSAPAPTLTPDPDLAPAPATTLAAGAVPAAAPAVAYGDGTYIGKDSAVTVGWK